MMKNKLSSTKDRIKKALGTGNVIIVVCDPNEALQKLIASEQYKKETEDKAARIMNKLVEFEDSRKNIKS